MPTIWQSGDVTENHNTAASTHKAEAEHAGHVVYTVRQPGHSYWWQGTSKREAQKQLRLARSAGIQAVIYVE